ncbi:hypothetical protein COOONC_08104 [Cooperia oncophora]
MERSFAESLPNPIPIENTNYRHRHRLRERSYRPNLHRVLHRSFGVTSRIIGRDNDQKNETTERLGEKSFIGPPTNERGILWKLPIAPIESASAARTTEMPPPAWVVPSPISSEQKPVYLSDMLGTQSHAIDAAIAKIKSYIKAYKKTRPRLKKHPEKVSFGSHVGSETKNCEL